MRVLITGINGFIGNNICNYLENTSGYKIYGIGRGVYRYSNNIKYIEADISDETQFEKISREIEEIDAIIHCAACIDKNDFNLDLIRVNCQGTLNILKLGKEKGINKYIYISSLPVIGKPLETPINEDHITNPNTMYHVSKLMGESIISIGEKYGIKPISLRIPSPIGVGMNENTILPTFIKTCLNNEDIKIIGNGERIQNYIDIKDVCEAVYLCLVKDVKGIFNIASNISYSNRELANICKKVLNSKSKITFNGQKDLEEEFKWIVSVEKAKEILGFESKYSIEDSIIDLSKEFKI